MEVQYVYYYDERWVRNGIRLQKIDLAKTELNPQDLVEYRIFKSHHYYISVNLMMSFLGKLENFIWKCGINIPTRF